MIDSRRTISDRPSPTFAHGARHSLFAFLLVVAIAYAASFSQPVTTLTMGPGAATSVAFADTGVSSQTSGSATQPLDASAAPSESAASTQCVWDAQDWHDWELEVPRVPAPPGITAGQPLRVAVRALGPNGQPLQGAYVEITWVCPGHQFQDAITTGMFGDASVTRTLGLACRGRRCVVAVTVSENDLQGSAYSAFVPK